MKELNLIQVQMKAPKGQQNNFGKYKYRSLEDITQAVKPYLEDYKCSLTLNDEVVMVGDRIYVKATATLTNEKGESVSVNAFAREPLVKKGADDSQITGAASSYARKYACNGLFAIDSTDDADSMDNTPQKPTESQLQRLLSITPDDKKESATNWFNSNDYNAVETLLRKKEQNHAA